jgi:hypothetical protein
MIAAPDDVVESHHEQQGSPDDDATVVCYVDPKHPANAATVVAVDSDIILAELARPVGFSDSQFELIAIAAAVLPRERRDGFLRAVVGKLSATPSNGEVRAAIAAALG